MASGQRHEPFVLPAGNKVTTAPPRTDKPRALPVVLVLPPLIGIRRQVPFNAAARLGVEDLSYLMQVPGNGLIVRPDGPPIR